MPYLHRDDSGRVVALLAESNGQPSEYVSATDPEVLAFLTGSQLAPREIPAGGADDHARRQFAEMDGSMIRVIEDLLDVLIGKHLILLTDLPPDAQRKLLARKETRRSLLGDAAGMSPPVKEIF